MCCQTGRVPAKELDDEPANEPDPADFLDEPEDERPPTTLRRKPRGGQMIGAAMIGLAEVLDPKPKADVPIEIETPGEPPNIDQDGLDEPWGDAGERMVAPPMDTIKAKSGSTKAVKRRRA